MATDGRPIGKITDGKPITLTDDDIIYIMTNTNIYGPSPFKDWLKKEQWT